MGFSNDDLCVFEMWIERAIRWRGEFIVSEIRLQEITLYGRIR